MRSRLQARLHPILERGELLRRHPQPRFRASPDDVLRRARIFALDEKTHFRFGEIAAEIAPAVGLRTGAADRIVRASVP